MAYRLTRRGFVHTVVAAATAAVAPRAFALGKIEKPKLTLGLAVPGASFLPVYVAAARTWNCSIATFTTGALRSQILELIPILANA